MKRNVEIFLKGKGKLELESKILDNFGLEVTYNISDIEDVGSRKTNYSKSFNIVGTPKNNILFQHIYEVNFESNTFDINAKQPCYVTVNGNIVMDGYLKLRSITKTYIAGKYQIIYNVNIYDAVKDIFTEFSDKNLRDLDFSQPFTFMKTTYDKGNHVFNLDTIKNSQARLLTNKNTYDYPIVNWNYNGVNEGERYPLEKGFTLSQFYPSVYVKAILDKMFYDIGYTYESDFFNGNIYDGIFPSLATIYNDSVMLVKNTKYFSHKYLAGGPYGGQSFNYAYGKAQQPDGPDGPVPIKPEDDDPSSRVKMNVITNYQTDYIAQTDGGIKIMGNGDYTFSGTITMKWLTIGRNELDGFDRVQLRNQDGKVLSEYVFDDAPPILNPGSLPPPYVLQDEAESDIVFPLDFGTISLKEGDVVYAWYKCGYIYYPTNYLGNSARWYDYELNVSIANNDNVIDKIDTELNLSDFLPNMSQSDFLKSIIKQFNLYIYPVQNVEKHVIIEPRRVFYNKGKILDWTNKVVDDTLVIEPLNKKLSRYYNFKMDAVPSIKTDLYFNKWKSNYGSKEIDLNNEDIQGVNNIESKFAGYDYKYWQNSAKTDYIFVPNFTKDINDSIITQKREIPPSIGFLKSHDTKGLHLGFVEDGVTVNKWNTICHVEKFGTSKTPYDLNFETKQGMPGGTINSYQNFWQSSMNNIFNNNNRIITYYVLLDIIDIKNIDFKNVILIKGELYYIENIVVDLNSNTPCKLTLIKAYDNLKFTTPEEHPILWGLVDTVGIIASGVGRPVASEAMMEDGYIVNENSESYFMIEPNCTLEQYFWFATPNQSVLNKKYSWACNEYNRGAIGGEVNLGGNLFPDPDIIDYHGVSYNLYIANYQTYIDRIKLDYEKNTNIS